jgi:putative endonuclease
MGRVFYVYMIASRLCVVYTGMTNDLVRRLREHRQKFGRGFTSQYNVDRLVWFEEHGNPTSAILREKEIKGWTRSKKVELIEGKIGDGMI